MQRVPFVLALLIGLFLPCSGFLILKLILRFSQKVTKNRSNANLKYILALIFVSSAFSAAIMVIKAQDLWSLLRISSSLILMSTIAFFDLLTGRIPIHFLIISVGVSACFSLQNDHWVLFVLGCLSNMVICMVFHWLGKRYTNLRSNLATNRPAFGMGDAYAAGALGALVGFPLSALGVVLALIFTAAFALFRTLLEKQSFIGMNIRLGPGFFMATLILFVLI